MGFALGSCIAQAIAYRYPKHVHLLVLLGRTSCWNQKALSVCQQLYEYRQAGAYHAYAKLIVATCFGQAYKENRCEQPWIDSIADAIHHSQTASGQKHQLAALYDFDSRPWASEIDVPTLVISMQEDPFATPQEGRLLAGLIPHAKQVVITCGHAVLSENISEVANTVLAFSVTH